MREDQFLAMARINDVGEKGEGRPLKKMINFLRKKIIYKNWILVWFN